MKDPVDTGEADAIFVVPRWARPKVLDYRRELALPDGVSDRMIYMRIVECKGMDADNERAWVRSLIVESEVKTRPD